MSEPSALDIVLNAAKASLDKHTPAHPDKVRWACDIVEKTLRPHIHQCCRQDEDGEFVDESEYSDSDVTLAVIDDDGVFCMECRKKLYGNTHSASQEDEPEEEPTIADGEGFLPKGTNVDKWLRLGTHTHE